MRNDFNLCPMCGSKKIECRQNRKWICPDCGFDLYNNVAAAVGVIIKDKYNNILFEVRAKEPRKGYLALPGGFVDFNESAEEAVVRECREEIGVELDINSIRFLCTNPNTYEYKNIEYKTCDMFFVADLPAKFDSINDYIKTLTAEESEVSEFQVHKVKTLSDIEKLPLAFVSAKSTLEKLISRGVLLCQQIES